MNIIQINPFVSFTLAIVLLFIGKGLLARVEWLRRYSIPDAVIGGVLCAGVVCALYYGMQAQLRFSLDARDMLLLYFFTAIGLNSDVRTLRQGGRSLIVLLALAVVFMIGQNVLGMAIAAAHGLDARAGLMVGSISLTGGVGTTVAWTPHFIDTLGIAGAGELGLAANTLGMIAACLVGGPLAAWLMRRHGIQPSGDAELDIGTLHLTAQHTTLDYYGVLLAVLWLNVAILFGQGISSVIELTGLRLPSFVGCLLAGIVLRAIGDLIGGRGGLWKWESMQPGVALISDISLGLFLVMALMGLQLWELESMLGFISIAMALQLLLVVLFIVFVVFRCMGRDYEAVVVCAGFGGIALGSTATAIANMTAVARQYGAAPRAFIVVPLVCGFFIDLVNALVIGLMAG